MPDKLLQIAATAAETAPMGLDLTDGKHLRDTEALAEALLAGAIPPAIADADPADFGTWAGVPAADLRRAAGL